MPSSSSYFPPLFDAPECNVAYVPSVDFPAIMECIVLPAPLPIHDNPPIQIPLDGAGSCPEIEGQVSATATGGITVEASLLVAERIDICKKTFLFNFNFTNDGNPKDLICEKWVWCICDPCSSAVSSVEDPSSCPTPDFCVDSPGEWKYIGEGLPILGRPCFEGRQYGEVTERCACPECPTSSSSSVSSSMPPPSSV